MAGYRSLRSALALHPTNVADSSVPPCALRAVSRPGSGQHHLSVPPSSAGAARALDRARGAGVDHLRDPLTESRLPTKILVEQQDAEHLRQRELEDLLLRDVEYEMQLSKKIKREVTYGIRYAQFLQQ